MEKSCFIGVDIDTAGTKAAIFDTEGRKESTLHKFLLYQLDIMNSIEQGLITLYKANENWIDGFAKSIPFLPNGPIITLTIFNFGDSPKVV